MNKKIFISQVHNQWRVEMIGSDESTTLHTTQADALKQARQMVDENGAELLVKNDDGTIRWKNFIWII